MGAASSVIGAGWQYYRGMSGSAPANSGTARVAYGSAGAP
jgi:hypothetical protein